ncbi:DUF1642 domain-containing protein [Lacticaseibacillus paracasei]|uniref:DUF1642 domain-containing protein n=1 Tax=Lacticaseibacillus paracasei TaxID=1597 RepID=UPI003B513EF8
MSEEKLYAVKKNHSDEFWDFLASDNFWTLGISDCPTTTSKKHAELVADEQGGHVVTFVEEPEKVVLTKKQAEIVEDAHDSGYPATEIFSGTSSGAGEERLLMKAYVNGYTVAKEKKYNVKVPHTKEAWYYQSGDTDLLTICPADKELRGKFTEAEIEHYGLQDCEKVECDNDD